MTKPLADPDLHKRCLIVLDLVEDARVWLHEAPLTEIEAIEKVLERNAPFDALHDAMQQLAIIAAALYARIGGDSAKQEESPCNPSAS